MKLSQLSEYDRAVAEFMVGSFNPPIILKTVPKIYVETKVKMTGHNLYCSLVIYLPAIPPQIYGYCAQAHLFFVENNFCWILWTVNCTTPKKYEALDGCFIDNRYIGKYEALDESFCSLKYESQIMMILMERMIVKYIAKGTTDPRHRVLWLIQHL